MGDNYYNEGNVSTACPAWAPIVGFMGIASAVVFASTSSCLNGVMGTTTRVIPPVLFLPI